MKKLITLRGNSGSGKTTIARALQEKFGKNTMLLSQDVIRRDILKTNDGAGTRANDVLIMLLEYGHAHNELVILEGILNSRWYTPLFDAAKALYGENICAYYFDLPFEETLRRHQTKDKRTEFGEKEMRRWWNEKDYAPALNEQTLTPDMMQDEIIDRICADLERLDAYTIHINSKRARFSPLFFVYCVIFCPNFYRCKNNFIAFCSYL